MFRDLTGDRRQDAVVRVQSGGADGAVALYVFSTDTGVKNSGLKVVFRSQELRRAQTRVRDGVVAADVNIMGSVTPQKLPERDVAVRHDPANHAAALHMVTMQGGVFGCVSDSVSVIEGTTWEDAS